MQYNHGIMKLNHTLLQGPHTASWKSNCPYLIIFKQIKFVNENLDVPEL